MKNERVSDWHNCDNNFCFDTVSVIYAQLLCVTMKNDFEIIELKNYNDLPMGVEFVLYEPPFYGDEIHEVVTEFKKKFGNYPQIIYRLGKQLFVVKL